MVRKISLSDITMNGADGFNGETMSFRQKIEFSKLMDRLGVSAIETHPISVLKADSLLIKSLASAIKNSILTVPVDFMDPESVDVAWNAVRLAVHPRLQVTVPVSTVQMEYKCHKKPEAVISMISDCIGRCLSYCRDVEFIAEDFSRSDRTFLKSAVMAAVESGAGLVTLKDVAGILFPNEFSDEVRAVKEYLPDSVRLGVWCSNDIYLADSCSILAAKSGADEVKVCTHKNNTTYLKHFCRILEAKPDYCSVTTDVNLTEMDRVVAQANEMCFSKKSMTTSAAFPIDGGLADLRLTSHDSCEAVKDVVEKLGYQLSVEDNSRVYDTVIRLASKNGIVEAKELDAIVASVAFQLPETYRLCSYLINTGNNITATCHLILEKNGEQLENVSIGDGPVDAAFQAIEKMVGKSYELDDFQIRSITEGREAMGETIVRLRYEGKIFSGRGVSHDIVGSSIMAYLSAVNKIVYEEA